MSWNESGNGKDPWKRDDNEPTDLDQIVRNWQRRLSALLGGGGGGGGRASQGAGGSIFLLVLLVGAWMITGFYRIDEAERGVVQRFGAYTGTTMPGLHWRIPFPIESVSKVNANEVSDYPYSTEMLTADLQYVNIDMVVQFRRTDPVDFSFNVVDPELTLQDVTQSALREVVGTTELDVLIAARREEIASRTRDVLQRTLDDYGAGITVSSIALENVNYPDSVQAAVDDAQKARNDSDRYELEADAYARDVIPKAEGEAARILQDAEAYRERVTADADGEAARFEALLTEYQKAPEVTRERLYIDAIEEVYGRSNKVFLDASGSGNLLYLPVDQLMKQGMRQAPVDVNRSSDSPTPQQQRTDIRIEPVDPRERRTRDE
jgi:membrane protease subunit HflK